LASSANGESKLIGLIGALREHTYSTFSGPKHVSKLKSQVTIPIYLNMAILSIVDQGEGKTANEMMSIWAKGCWCHTSGRGGGGLGLTRRQMDAGIGAWNFFLIFENFQNFLFVEFQFSFLKFFSVIIQIHSILQFFQTKNKFKSPANQINWKRLAPEFALDGEEHCGCCCCGMGLWLRKRMRLWFASAAVDSAVVVVQSSALSLRRPTGDGNRGHLAVDSAAAAVVLPAMR
jgi:hypothetical protein